MARRLTADEWQAARQRWEADPTLSFEALAEDLSVSRQAVSKKAKQEGWTKVGNLRQVAERAQLQADSKVAQVAGATAKKATFEASVEIRADVIDRHRVDWAEHRKHFTVEGIKTDFENGKKAKISAEMLLIRQKGERAAYGLEEGGAPPPSGNGELLKEIAALLPT